MEIILPLVIPTFDDERLSDEVKKDFDNRCRIYLYKEEEDWESEELSHVFSLRLEYGIGNEKCFIWFEVDLNDLEMFANSLMKSIEMLRRDYSEVIKHKINNGYPI